MTPLSTSMMVKMKLLLMMKWSELYPRVVYRSLPNGQQILKEDLVVVEEEAEIGIESERRATRRRRARRAAVRRARRDRERRTKTNSSSNEA